MRPFNRPSRRSLLVLGLIGGAATLIAIGVIALLPASATTAQNTKHSDGRHCVRLDMIDSIQALHVAQPGVPPQDEHVGWMSSWFSTDRSVSGPKLTGTGAGILAIIRDTPGQIGGIGWSDEIVQLPGGAIHMFGSYNRPAAIRQKWLTMRVTGISGKYAGMTGSGRWRILSITNLHVPTEGIINICAGGR